jgi:hypothetical protein
MKKLSTVKRGDTWNFVFTWKDNNQAPVDLSDCTARMQIRKKKVGTLLAEVSTNNGIVIDGPLGKISVTFSATMTDTVEPGTHDTDLEVTFTSSSEVKSTPTLQITVEEDITRDE